MDDKRVVIDHDNVWIHHLKVLVNLVETKPLLLRILIRRCVVGDNSSRDLANKLTLGMALKPEMIRLHGRGQLRQLL